MLILTQVQSNTDTRSQFDRGGDDPCKPLSHAKKRQPHKYKTFNKDSRQSKLVADWSTATWSNDGEREVGVQTHTRSQSNRHVGKQTHAEGGESSDGGGTSNEITIENTKAELVVNICGAVFSSTDASSSASSQDGSIDLKLSVLGFRSGKFCLGEAATDRNNVCHSKERSQTSANLSQESRALTRLGMS